MLPNRKTEIKNINEADQYQEIFRMTSSAVMTTKMRICHKRMKTPGPAAFAPKNENKEREKTRTNLAAFGKNSWTSCKQAPQFAWRNQDSNDQMEN